MLMMLVACNKQETSTEQNPYRKVLEYKPSTVTMAVPGTLTPTSSYDWLTMSQSGGTATFTTTRNFTGKIRRAEFSIAGSNFIAVISQKYGSIDASLSSSLVSQALGQATVDINISTSNIDDYASWGVIYGKENDMSKGTKLPQSSMFVAGSNQVTITGLEEGTDYYVWAYVVTTEGDVVYTSNTTGIVPPVYVLPTDDLQAAIDGAKDYAEVRVTKDHVHQGQLVMRDKVNVSGGWNSDFTEQSYTEFSVIDGGFEKVNIHDPSCKGVQYQSATAKTAVVAGTFTAPLKTGATLSQFEVRNGFNSNDGGGISIAGNFTINHCYVHDCHSNHRGGGIMNTENVEGTIVIANTIIKDCSTLEHGGAFSVEESNTTWTMVNCLIEGNVSRKGGGYCGVAMIYNHTKFYAINNTIVDNINWDEGGTPPDARAEWSIIHTRGGTTDQVFTMINNLIVGNYSWCSSDGIAYPQYYNLAVNCASDGNAAVNVRNNMICGGIWKDGSAGLNGMNTIMASDLDLTTIFQNPAASEYTPIGSAKGTGVYDSDVSSIMGAYSKDLYGNPRTSGGSIDLGCIQAQ